MTKKSISLLIFFLTFAFYSKANEIDQFSAEAIKIKDSNQILSKTFNRILKDHLKKIKKSYSCQQVVKKLGYGFYGLSTNKLKQWILENQEEVGVFQRDNSKSIFMTLKGSIYEKVGVGLATFYKLSPVINIGGVKIGVDKLIHSHASGIIYYSKYLKALKKGLTENNAQIKAIKWGVFMEKGLLGLLGSGVFSYGDLEADYQGLVMYKSFCNGKNPRLKMDESGRWKLAREVSLKDYVNPYMNEIYNPNSYNKRRTRLVAKAIRAKYCNQRYLFNINFFSGMERYRRMSQKSFSERYLEYLREQGKIPDNQENSLFNICQ